MKNQIVKDLLSRKVRFDLEDSEKTTPFLRYYLGHQYAIAYELLALGANINQMNIKGQFALKHAVV